MDSYFQRSHFTNTFKTKKVSRESYFVNTALKKYFYSQHLHYCTNTFQIKNLDSCSFHNFYSYSYPLVKNQLLSVHSQTYSYPLKLVLRVFSNIFLSWPMLTNGHSATCKNGPRNADARRNACREKSLRGARNSRSYREGGIARANSMRALLAHEFIDIAQLINLNSPT